MMGKYNTSKTKDFLPSPKNSTSNRNAAKENADSGSFSSNYQSSKHTPVANKIKQDFSERVETLTMKFLGESMKLKQNLSKHHEHRKQIAMQKG